MGSHSPAFALSASSREQILETVIRPTIAGMAGEGREYRGILYAGLMLTADGPKVLEFNCRLGDPETQSVLRRLDGDLAAVFSRCRGWPARSGLPCGGRTRLLPALFSQPRTIPDSPRVGDEITGIADAEALPGVVVFHAGTRRDGDRLLTAGGRVLSVTATGETLAEAIDLAYRAAGRIHFEGVHFRSDIGADTLGMRIGRSGG